ncbi:MAG TPA: hypothetical protein V6C97_27545, partial [Oculatellaceae cyanobacterium]
SSLAARLNFRSIKVYLYGVRSLHVDLGYADPMSECVRLERLYRGIKRDQGERSVVKRRLPVTTSMLLACQHLFDFHCHNHRMLFAAMCTATGGLFRVGEITVSSSRKPDPLRMLTLSSIRPVHRVSGSAPALLEAYAIHLRVSKTDPFRREVDVHVCWPPAVAAIASMLRQLPLSLRRSSTPLFAFENGLPLARSALLAVTEHVLRCTGVDSSQYSGVSFRRGGATSLSCAGVSDRVVQLMGRWISSTYTRYIETQLSEFVAAGRRM